MARLMTPRLLRRLALLTALCACLPLGHAGYMNAKAELAQVLLQHAWQQRLTSGAAVKPWPWADTTPVARLQVARLGVDEIILSGDSGRTLAFGPGWAESTALPGAPGLSVVSAHRDTHFSFLRDIRIGDRVQLQNALGTRQLRVNAMWIVDSRRQTIDLATDTDELILVTCFPFDALSTRGPLRFVVAAVPDGSS